MERCLILHGTKLCQLLASRSVCKWRVQPRDSDLKERFLSFVCLFIYFFCHPHFSFFFSSYFFCYPNFFPSAFSHPHPPSAGIRSAYFRHPRKSVSSRVFQSKRRFFRRNYCILRIFFPRVTLLASSGQPQRQRFKKTSKTKTLNVQHTDVVRLDWNGDAIVAIVAEKWQRPFTPKGKFASSLHQWRSSWLRFRRWDITIQRLKS